MNPFGLAVPFPYHLREGKLLAAVLAQQITDPAQIDMLVRSAAGNLPALNRNQPPGDMWHDGLDAVSRAGALLRLGEELLKLKWAPAVQEAATAMLAARPALERRIHGGQVVIDRRDLRSAIALLADDDEFESVRVLLVRGDPKTGKSWSRHLFVQTARERDAEVTYLATMGDVGNVVRKLFDLLDGTDLLPPMDTTETAWYGDVVNGLRRAAARRKQALWIAVDNLGPGPDGVTPLIDPKVREFFEEFALQLVDPAINQYFRLMLIHYPDGKVPTRWDADLWREDRPQREKVDLDAVIEVLNERLTDRAEHAADDTVRSWAEEVLAAAEGASGEERLRLIQQALVKRLRVMTGGPS